MKYFYYYFIYEPASGYLVQATTQEQAIVELKNEQLWSGLNERWKIEEKVMIGKIITF